MNKILPKIALNAWSWGAAAAGGDSEDNILVKIPNEVFCMLSDDYLAEQKEIQSSIPEREKRLEKLNGSVANVSVFLKRQKSIPSSIP